MIRILSGSLAALAISSAPALAQTLAHGSAPAISWWRIVAALVLCLLLAVGAAVALHFRMTGKMPSLKAARLRLPAFRGAPITRLFSGPEARRLKSIETIRVSPYADVCLFTCDGQTFLVAATPQGVTVIERKDDASSPEPAS